MLKLWISYVYDIKHFWILCMLYLTYISLSGVVYSWGWGLGIMKTTFIEGIIILG